ncbi:hypothetical protein ACIRBX_22480 [Kitasatospora sp. NPDC096147]|uniref:hypothetical protein n=1 Tax=Kitasatospora sp. NPDC096147 TaxID=3364093 RepID=UPI0037FEB7D0
MTDPGQTPMTPDLPPPDGVKAPDIVPPSADDRRDPDAPDSDRERAPAKTTEATTEEEPPD